MKFTSLLKSVILEQSKFEVLFDALTKPSVDKEGKKMKPKLHIFGHIHEQYGILSLNETTFINASICNLRYKPDNKPIVIELSRK